MITSIHAREFPGVAPEAIGDLLDSLGQLDDRLWPTNGRWPAMVLDGPLDTHPAGGHGLVRYSTISYDPGRSVVFRFLDEVGLRGSHTFEIDDGESGGVLRHTLSATAVGSMRLLWPLAVRPLHDQCLEDLLDQAADTFGLPAESAPPTRWVRFLLAVGPSPETEDAIVARRLLDRE